MKPANRPEILRICKEQDGYVESPPNSNLTKYGKWYGADGEPWCAMCVCWIYNEAKNPFPGIQSPKGAAYVPYIYDFYKKWNTPATPKLTTEPKGADVVIYDWNADKLGDHIGIFIDWVEKGKSFHAWEGNTSPANDSNGGKFMLRLRYVSNVLCFIDADGIQQVRFVTLDLEKTITELLTLTGKTGNILQNPGDCKGEL